MENWEIIALVFFALNALITGREAIPILLFVWKPETMRIFFDEAGKDRECIAASSALRDGSDALASLGFSLLGLKCEQLPLWGRTIREIALVARQADTYASIVLRKNGEPASAYFFTPFRDGGMVFTRNRPFGTEVEGHRLSVKSVPDPDFRNVFDVHARRVRHFLDGGAVPTVGSTRQSRIDMTRNFYHSAYSRRYGKYLQTPAVLGFFLSIALTFGILILFCV
jgi:hypothetical protein